MFANKAHVKHIGLNAPDLYIATAANLLALDVSSGEEVWKISGAACSVFVSPDNFLYVGTTSVKKINPMTQSVVWQTSSLGGNCYVSVSNNGMVFVSVKIDTGDTPGKICRLNPHDGSVIWSVTNIGQGCIGSAVDPDGYFYCGNYDGVVSKRDPSDGSADWSEDIGSRAYNISFGNDYLYVCSTKYIKKVEPADGSVEWTSADFGGFSNAYPCVSPSKVYGGGSGGRVYEILDSDGTTVRQSTDWGSNAVLASDDSGVIYAGWSDGSIRKLSSTLSEVWVNTDYGDAVRCMATNYYSGWEGS